MRSTILSARRNVRAALAVLTTLLVGAVALAVAPASNAAAPAAVAPTASAVRNTLTTLTLNVHHCDGCRVQLQNDQGYQSRRALVQDGKAVFRLGAIKTKGLSIQITGPWEATSPNPAGYSAFVTMRYGFAQAGDSVTWAQAHTAHKGTACWAGTTARNQSMSIQARQVPVTGTTGPAYSTLAWASPTRAYVRGHLEELTDMGVYGAQDVPDC